MIEETLGWILTGGFIIFLCTAVYQIFNKN